MMAMEVDNFAPHPLRTAGSADQAVDDRVVAVQTGRQLYLSHAHATRCDVQVGGGSGGGGGGGSRGGSGGGGGFSAEPTW